MDSATAANFKVDDLFLLALAAGVAAGASFAIFMACFHWFRRDWVRREQCRLQKQILSAIADAGRDPDDLFLTGRDASAYGELVAQFKVNHGKQVVSVLESEGRRFIHIDGELSAQERAKMVRYLKSEGFMS